jgi:hypothetical protein
MFRQWNTTKTPSRAKPLLVSLPVMRILRMRNILPIAIACGLIVSFMTLQRRLLMEEAVSDQSLPRRVPPRKTRSSEEHAHHAFLLQTSNTTLLAQAPYREMQFFLRKHSNSTGSRFIQHLQEQLYGRPEWEPHRQNFCERTLPLCIGGYHNSISKISSGPFKASSHRFSTSLDRVFNYYNNREDETFLPLLPHSNFTTVYHVRHFRDTNHAIINLGTNKVCLPLLLAAASIDPDHGMVVELGPFAGFSSKCAAYGVLAAMQSNDSNVPNDPSTTSRLVSFDTFQGEVNFGAIVRKSSWVKEVYPSFTKQNSNFVKLWEDTVQDVYPQAKAIVGHINTLVVTDEKIKQQVSELSTVTPQVFIIDTVKTSKLLHEHLGGLTLHVGTVVFLMDFQRTKDLIQQIYGCFRQNYLLPVYISWNNEHVAFVVKKSFTVNDQEIFQCYQRLAATNFHTTTTTPPHPIHMMQTRVKQDLMFLSGLTTNADIHERFRVNLRDQTLTKWNRAIEEQDEWTWRILLGLGDRSLKK